jgi:hypothetical protein
MFFLKKISTNSECQFKSDFGEYPPKPLEPMKLNSQFDVLCMGKVRLFYHNLSQFFSVCFLTAVGKPPFYSSNHIPGLIEIKNLILKIKKSVAEQKTDWIKNATHFKNSTFQLKFIFFVCFTAMFVPVALLYFVFKLILLCINISPLLWSCMPNDKVVGFFLNLTTTSSQIVVNTSALRKCKNSVNKLERTMSFETIVSHEHIHLLQSYYFPERAESERARHEYDNEKTTFFKSLLKDPERDFDFAFYYFSINEMEARLHEVVLSYYRKYGELPSDVPGFLQMLLGSSSEVMNTVKTHLLGKRENRPYRERHVFDVRGKMEESQMITAIYTLTDSWAYLLDVLPVLYGNLLIVYGDTNRAKKYFDTVSSFELYNQLYGEIIIPA